MVEHCPKILASEASRIKPSAPLRRRSRFYVIEFCRQRCRCRAATAPGITDHTFTAPASRVCVSITSSFIENIRNAESRVKRKRYNMSMYLHNLNYVIRRLRGFCK